MYWPIRPAHAEGVCVLCSDMNIFSCGVSAVSGDIPLNSTFLLTGGVSGERQKTILLASCSGKGAHCTQLVGVASPERLGSCRQCNTLPTLIPNILVIPSPLFPLSTSLLLPLHLLFPLPSSPFSLSLTPFPLSLTLLLLPLLSPFLPLLPPSPLSFSLDCPCTLCHGGGRHDS